MARFVFTNLDKIETKCLIEDKLGLPHIYIYLSRH